MWDLVLVILAVAATVVWLIRRFWRAARSRGISCECGGCARQAGCNGSCSTDAGEIAACGGSAPEAKVLKGKNMHRP